MRIAPVNSSISFYSTTKKPAKTFVLTGPLNLYWLRFKQTYIEGLIMSYRVLRYAALGKQIFQKNIFLFNLRHASTRLLCIERSYYVL